MTARARGLKLSSVECAPVLHGQCTVVRYRGVVSGDGTRLRRLSDEFLSPSRAGRVSRSSRKKRRISKAVNLYLPELAFV